MANARQFLAARTGAWAKSGYTARDYVQDGLLYQYDGIENDGYGVHNPNAQWMTELVSGIKTNFLSTDRQIVGDNHIELIGIGTVAHLRQDNAVMAFEIVCSDVFCPNRNFAPLYYAASGRNRVVSIVRNGVGFCGHIKTVANISGIASVSANYTTTNGGDGNFIANVNCEDAILSSRGDTWQSNSNNYFGGTGGYYAAGKIYSIRAYDHNLTTSEIAANYAVDKARFDLSVTA